MTLATIIEIGQAFIGLYSYSDPLTHLLFLVFIHFLIYFPIAIDCVQYCSLNTQHNGR